MLKEKIKVNNFKVGVIGLGYVGLPLAMEFADKNVSTIGFDLDENKVKDIKSFDRWWSEEDEKEGEWLVRRFAKSKKLPLNFYIDVGVLEKNDPNQLFNSNRHFRNVLKTKGYPIFYTEFLGGHDFICWRSSIADGLIYLIGK